MDSDLESMSRDQLIAEVRKLRNGVRQHRDSSGQELCWHHPQLWALLPEKTDRAGRAEWPQFMREFGIASPSRHLAGCPAYYRTLPRAISSSFPCHSQLNAASARSSGCNSGLTF